MSFYRILIVICTLSAALAVAGCDPTSEPEGANSPIPIIQAPELTSRAIDQTTNVDAIPLRPPRSGWEPGLVFEGSVAGDVLNAERVVCTNLLGDAKPSSNQLIIQTGQATRQSGFLLGAELANDLIPGVDVGADLAKLQREQMLEVNANRAEYRYYTLEDQLRLEPTQTCMNAIALLKQRGQFDNRVFVVPAVFAVQGVTYTLTRSTEAGGEVRASIAKLVDAAAKAGYKKTQDSKGTTIINNDGWITLRVALPVLIKEWDVSGTVGAGDKVTITVDEVPPNITGVNAAEIKTAPTAASG